MQEIELAEMLDDRFLDRALEGEVELLQGFAGWEPGGADPAFAAVRFAGGDLGGEQGLGELLIAALLGPRSLRELGQRPGRGGGFELSEQVGELGGLAHAISRS